MVDLLSDSGLGTRLIPPSVSGLQSAYTWVQTVGCGELKAWFLTTLPCHTDKKEADILACAAPYPTGFSEGQNNISRGYGAPLLRS